ncbi:Ribonuclease VapC [Candidatus Electronema halotolerans]
MLLDTNILSELMRPSPFPAVVEWLDAQPAEQLFISAVTQAEIELGLALLPEGRRKNELLQAAKEIFSLFDGRNLPFDAAAAQEYALIVAARVKAGRPVSVEDAQISYQAPHDNIPERSWPLFRAWERISEILSEHEQPGLSS